MKTLRLLPLLLAAIFPLTAIALKPTNETILLKADRALAEKEWANAQALYLLLEDKEPELARAYTGNIIASEMRNQQTEAVNTLARGIKVGIAPDSILDPFRSAVRRLGEPGRYPELLREASVRMPYMSRVFDARLLNYYAFHRDSECTIEYANKLLMGVPTDTRFLLILGRAYMDEGNMTEAVNAWERVLAADPSNFDALVCMGNYLHMEGNPGAGAYLERAYEVKPTPFVANLIGR